MSSETQHELEIAAIALTALCGLFGVYVVLFVLSIWSITRSRTTYSKRLLIVTTVLFLDLLAHFIVRSLEFARARLQDDSDHETLVWDIPLTVVGNVTTTFAGLLSDGTLVWRFYVVFDRRPWAKYIPGIAVVINAFLCWSADAQHFAIYHNRSFYENTLLPVTLDITVAWGWLMFTVNTLLTGGILYKIMSTSHGLDHDSPRPARKKGAYNMAIRAIVESALVTWVGLLIYEITSLAPTGHVTTNLNVGYVMSDIIPIFFGISQTLITARIGLSREISDSTVVSERQDRIRVYTSQEHTTSEGPYLISKRSDVGLSDEGVELPMINIHKGRSARV